MINVYIYQIASFIIRIIDTLILIRVVLSWIAPYSNNGFTDMVYNLTEPLLAPLRRILPNSTRVDWSPILLYVVLIVIQRLMAVILF